MLGKFGHSITSPQAIMMANQIWLNAIAMVYDWEYDWLNNISFRPYADAGQSCSMGGVFLGGSPWAIANWWIKLV